MMWYYGGSGWTGGGWGGFALMALSMIVWFALLGALLMALARWFQSRPASGSALPPPDAREILRQRFARGEVDATTYHAMLAELNRPSGAA